MLRVVANNHDLSDELVDLSYSLSSNEGTSFSASLPTLNVVLRFAITSETSFVYLNKGDIVQMSVDGGNGLTLYARVIECTELKQKGVVEVSATGEFFNQTNDIWGTIFVDKDTWENTRTKFGLEAVEHYENNNKFYAHVQSKADLVMALAWSYDTKRAVSLTPFTTYDTKFSSFGAGIFKQLKEASDTELYTPFYKLTADDIIRYEVSAAQPPVTHITSLTAGTEGPVPSIPEILVRSNVPRLNAYDYTRSFIIEELQLGAMVVIHTKQPEDPEDDVLYDKTVIYWTDGIRTEITDYDDPDDFAVIGITPNCYLLKDATDDYKVVLRDRQTNEVLATRGIWGFDFEGLGKSHYLKDTSGNYSTICLFKNALVVGQSGSRIATIGFFVSSNNEVNLIQTSPIHLEHFDTEAIDVVDSCKVRWSDGTVALSVLLKSTPVPGLTPMNYYGQLSFTVAFWPTLTLIQEVYSSQAEAVAFLASRITPTATNPLFIITHKVLSLGMTEDLIVGVYGNDTYLYGQLVLERYVRPQEVFVYDKDVVVEDFSQFYLLSVPSSEEGTWNLMRISVATDEDEEQYLELSTIQTGNAIDWAFNGMPENGRVELMHNMVLVVKTVGEPDEVTGQVTYASMLQLGPVPMLVRSNIISLTPQQIGSGIRNELTLNYKVGLLTQSDLNSSDEGKGRIEISLAGFQVYDPTTQTWLNKSTQDLNVMAIGSYVDVTLDVEGLQQIKVRVMGYRITYSGVIKATLIGLIV